MSRTAARLVFLCALVGLAPQPPRPTCTTTCSSTRPTPASATSTRRSAARRSIRAASARFAASRSRVFGAIWFAFAALLAVSGPDRAAAALRESVPGYLFAVSTLALAVVLYLGYASFVDAQVVCLLCLTTYAAVIGLFLISGAATSISHDDIASPRLASISRCSSRARSRSSSPSLCLGGAASALAFFPARSAVARRRRFATCCGRRAGPDRVRALHGHRSRACRSSIPTDGAKVLIVKFNDFQCPACRQAYVSYKPIFAKYKRETPAPCARAEGLSARSRLQREPDERCCTRPPATRPWPSASRANTIAASRWRSGVSRTRTA